jgi:hypothetical protein
VRLTEFWRRMQRRFGESYADSVASDQVLPQLGGRTVHDALASGVAARDVWRAVCDYYEIPARER